MKKVRLIRKSKSIKEYFLVSLLVTAVVLDFFIGIFIYFSNNATINDGINKQTSSFEEKFIGFRESQTQLFSAVFESLVASVNNQELFLAGSRDQFYSENKKAYEHISNKYSVTQWQLIDSGGKVFLRMQDPSNYGDIISNATLEKARVTGNTFSGVEVEKNGVALRVYIPWKQGDKLIGYFEVSQDLSLFFSQLTRSTGGDYSLVISKSYFGKEYWGNLRDRAGLKNNWYDFQDHLVLGSSMSEQPYYEGIINKYIDSREKNMSVMSDNTFGKYFYNDKLLGYGVVPFSYQGDPLGAAMLVTVDMSGLYHSAISGMMSSMIVASIIIFFIGLIFYFLIDKYIFARLNLIMGYLVTASGYNYHVKLPIEPYDELGRISESINQLFKEVSNSHREMEKTISDQTKLLGEASGDLENRQAAILNILEDIEGEKLKTEQSAQELEKFKLAVENASEHIVITDLDANILYANKAVERITGFEISEVLGNKAGSKDMWGGLMNKNFYGDLWVNIKKKKKIFTGEVRNIRKNGEEYDAAVSIAPVMNAAGKVLFFVGIERDITKEKDVDRTKTEFVSLASHQLRTPLSSINWYAEMLLEGDVGDLSRDQKKYVDEIYKGNQRMVGLVNALLDVSRLELGTFSVEPEIIEIKGVIESVIKELEAQSLSKGIKISQKYTRNVPKKYKADKNLFRIIIQNLLSNSVKYTPENGRVSIDISRNGSNLAISVKDTGYGIPESQKDKIFTKLFRADNVTQMDTEGTGLGLYIIKSIVDVCNGRIWFVSKENKGTVFNITLPIAGMKERLGSKRID